MDYLCATGRNSQGTRPSLIVMFKKLIVYIMTKNKKQCPACGIYNYPKHVCDCRNYKPSYAAIHGHIRVRNKPTEAQTDLDSTQDVFKVYAHNVYLFRHHSHEKAFRRVEALGYSKSSVKFVLIKD